MKNILSSIFNKGHNIIIGALHLPPMPGYEEYPGFDVARKNALADLNAFEQGGVDAVIFENNYDIPHYEYVSPEVAAMMERLGDELLKQATLPLGISVLWNDYKTALTIAKKLGLKFVRIPVFVDDVESRYGRIQGDPDAMLKYRREIEAEDVAIFADIHVKHSTIHSSTSITEAATLAIQKGSDALIITGKWTGDAPDYGELEAVRNAVGDFPIIVGSGARAENIKDILRYANGVIVSTALKEGGVSENEKDNLKGWDQRISKEKVKAFMRAFE